VVTRYRIAESLLAQDKKEDARKEIEQALLISANNKARNFDLAIVTARLDLRSAKRARPARPANKR